MEISANNGHTIASEAGNGGLQNTSQVDDSARESELLKNKSSPFVADRMESDDMRMTVNTKKRAFGEESKNLHSPSKKPAICSSLGAVNSDMVSVLNNFSSREAMNIDSTQEEDGDGLVAHALGLCSVRVGLYSCVKCIYFRHFFKQEWVSVVSVV